MALSCFDFALLLQVTREWLGLAVEGRSMFMEVAKWPFYVRAGTGQADLGRGQVNRGILNSARELGIDFAISHSRRQRGRAGAGLKISLAAWQLPKSSTSQELRGGSEGAVEPPRWLKLLLGTGKRPNHRLQHHTAAVFSSSGFHNCELRALSI